MAAPGAHMRIFLCLLKCITIQLANENPGPQSTCVLNQTPVACSASCPGKESPVALVPPLFCLIALCLAGPMNPLIRCIVDLLGSEADCLEPGFI